MLTIDSLFSGSFLGQLRNIALMKTTSRDAGASPRRITEPTPHQNNSRSASPPAPAPEPIPRSHPKPASPKARSSRRGPRPGTRIICPDPGSLYDIMHDNAGTSLYAMPMCWTDRHSELLGIQFDRHPTIEKPVPENLDGRWLEPSHMARVLTAELQVLVRADPSPTKLFCKNRAIKHVMSTLFPHTLSKPKTSAELDLFFGMKAFRKAVRLPCVWKSAASRDASFDSMATLDPYTLGRPSDTEYAPNLPILAYVNRSQLAAIRKNLFRIAPGPNGTPNEPVARLQALRSKLLVPTNTDHDPYIVAILLAMAQAHFYRIPAYSGRMTPSGSGSAHDSQKGVRLRMPQFRDIKVQLITHDEGQESDPHFIVYTAVITAAFLERFMTPHKTPSFDSEVGLGMKITYTPVKVWPILGLKERLAKALGPEISGVSPFDNPDFIDLHGPLVEPAPEQLPVFAHIISQRKLKRRRDKERQPLEEMLNSSFEEEPPSSDDRPVLSPSAKRRRTARSVGTLEVC